MWISGRSDGESIRKVINKLKPRRAIIVRGHRRGRALADVTGNLEALQAVDRLVSAAARPGGMSTLGLLERLIADPVAMESVAMLARVIGIAPKSDKRT